MCPLLCENYPRKPHIAAGEAANQKGGYMPRKRRTASASPVGSKRECDRIYFCIYKTS